MLFTHGFRSRQASEVCCFDSIIGGRTATNTLQGATNTLQFGACFVAGAWSVMSHGALCRRPHCLQACLAEAPWKWLYCPHTKTNATSVFTPTCNHRPLTLRSSWIYSCWSFSSAARTLEQVVLPTYQNRSPCCFSYRSTLLFRLTTLIFCRVAINDNPIFSIFYPILKLNIQNI